MQAPLFVKFLASAAIVSSGAGAAYVATNANTSDTNMRASVAEYKALPPTDAAYAGIPMLVDCQKTRTDKDASFADQAANTVGIIAGSLENIVCSAIGPITPPVTPPASVPAPAPADLDAVAQRHLSEMLTPYNPTVAPCEKARTDKDEALGDRIGETVTGVIPGVSDKVACVDQEDSSVTRPGRVDPECVAGCGDITLNPTPQGEDTLPPAPAPADLDAVAQRHLAEMLSPYNPPAPLASPEDFDGSLQGRKISAGITNLLNNR